MSISVPSFAIIPVPHFLVVYVKWANYFLNDLTKNEGTSKANFSSFYRYNIYGKLLSHTMHSHIFR